MQIAGTRKISRRLTPAACVLVLIVGGNDGENKMATLLIIGFVVVGPILGILALNPNCPA